MGTPNFSVPILEALIIAGHQICCVYSQPPRPAGRGCKNRLSPVHISAMSRGIDVRTTESLNNIASQKAFIELEADIAIVVAYGLILPKTILNATRFGCINIHASLLPRWRGAAPIQRAILSGDIITGITIMQMDQGLDTGDILLTDSIEITTNTDTSSLNNDLSIMGAKLIVDTLSKLENGCLTSTPQPTVGVTYATKLTKHEGLLDWTLPAIKLERMIRALTPWPGAWFEYNNERFSVLKAKISDNFGSPGILLDDKLLVACGEGSLRLLTIQRSGKTALDVTDFLRGYPLIKGTNLFSSCHAIN
ncbi:MAG: methionyl-tRNA formyltransferase [Rhodospirillaceae bacterium]|jgi:methionyl-tRNA formyltransferase|nr:methionyl-tRNA formyltransferase [Rhodospirillaceae bacterium]